jgi:hypothetical protein
MGIGDSMKSTTFLTITLIFSMLIAAFSITTGAQGVITDTNDAIAQEVGVANRPYLKSMSMAELQSTVKPSNEETSTRLSEPGYAFNIPPEMQANLTKEEFYRLQGIPGYFTPKQDSVQQISGEQVLLETYPPPVKAVVVVDEEMKWRLQSILGREVTWDAVQSWARSILEGGDDYLESPFGIDIQATIVVNWEDSPDDADIGTLLDDIEVIPPEGVGCDILLLMTGQISGLGTVGLANHMGQHFVMSVQVGYVINLFQHETTHLFGPRDHGDDLWTYCIMSYVYTPYHRGYCEPCTANIYDHRYRFTTINNPMHIVVLESEGGTTFPPPGAYTTDGPARITVYPDEGWTFIAWEITVGSSTWTEPPWNPCDVIYDHATVRPIFE